MTYAPEGCPCPDCGTTDPQECECRIQTIRYPVDLCSDDQGTVWGTEEADVCETHKCRVD